MFSQWIRQHTLALFNFVARRLAALGISPNVITLVGFFATCAIGIVLAFGYFALGGILIIIAGSLDGLDGALARVSNRATKFGAFLDSTTDRFAEGALFLGIMVAFLQRGITWVAYVVFAAMLGSVMVSYARARAEGIGVQCSEGWLTRFERIAILVVGLLLTAFLGDAPLLIALGVIALFANATAVQRVWRVYRATRT